MVSSFNFVVEKGGNTYPTQAYFVFSVPYCFFTSATHGGTAFLAKA
jgi:hypothetical protein